jgi:hypothetical protein
MPTKTPSTSHESVSHEPDGMRTDAGKRDAGTATETCTEPLDAWCQSRHCDDFRAFDAALHSADAHLPDFVIAECKTQRQVSLSDGFVGVVYVYDRQSGDLIGSQSFTDTPTEACPDGHFAGEPLEADCDKCELAGSAGYHMCTRKELTAARVETCMADPPPIASGCEECACTHCYRDLILCQHYVPDPNWSADEYCSSISADCLGDACPDCKIDLDAGL